MGVYHENKQNTMPIYKSYGKAKKHRKENEITVPFGSLYGERWWANYVAVDYFQAKYCVM